MVISLFLTGCQKDEPHEDAAQIENQESTFTIKQYSRKNIEKNTKLVSKLNMIEKYLDPITSALREFDNYSYPLDHYKSFAWDGLRDMDPNDILSLPINSTYANYRTIVIQNSTVCN